MKMRIGLFLGVGNVRECPSESLCGTENVFSWVVVKCKYGYFLMFVYNLQTLYKLYSNLREKKKLAWDFLLFNHNLLETGLPTFLSFSPLRVKLTYSAEFQCQIVQKQSHKENRNTNIVSWWRDQRKVNSKLWLHQTFTEQHRQNKVAGNQDIC